MNEPEIIDLPAVDDPPEQWIDHETWFPALPTEDIHAGNRMGRLIDPDNDDDNGGVE